MREAPFSHPDAQRPHPDNFLRPLSYRASMSKKIRYHIDPPHVDEVEKEKIAMLQAYEYKIICAWCKALMEIKTSTDPKMEGQESHSICVSCQKEVMCE